MRSTTLHGGEQRYGHDLGCESDNASSSSGGEADDLFESKAVCMCMMTV